MIKTMTNLVAYRELMLALAWKNITVRYKQAYLGITWAILKPLMLVLIFTLVKSFVGIDSGDIPYPVLTFAALMPWIFFQEAASEGVNSVVGNANLIRKIYFPHEIFPLTSVVTKLVEPGDLRLHGVGCVERLHDGRGHECLLPRCRERIAGRALAAYVRLASDISAHPGSTKVARQPGRRRVVQLLLFSLHA